MFRASPPWDAVTYWSLDLETGGFDAKEDAILAVGMVPIREGAIRLGERYASLVRPAATARVRAASVAVHELVASDFERAPPLGEVLAEIARRLREGVLLVHNASIDETFLRRAFARHRRPWPKPTVVDTAHLLVALHRRRAFLDPDRQGGDPEVNLTVARRELGLPEYPAHDALTDAIATAELFLVLRHRLGARRLRDLT